MNLLFLPLNALNAHWRVGDNAKTYSMNNYQLSIHAERWVHAKAQKRKKSMTNYLQLFGGH
jgi:hypothetical protein